VTYIQSLPRQMPRTHERVNTLRSWRRRVGSVLCVAPFIALLCTCFAVPASAKLGETVPQLVKRFGKSYTVEEAQLGKTYKFRSANISVDAVVSNGRSICETYFSYHPLTASGEPPNDIVRAVLRKNVPKARWLEIEAERLGADYALQSADGEYIAILKYTGPQPENSVWTMTVGPAKTVHAVSMAAPTILNFEDIPAPATIDEINGKYGRWVILKAAYLETDPAAHSGTRVLRLVKPGSEVFTQAPLVMNFRHPQTRVKLFAGSQFASLNGTLTAFDSESAGNVVATDGPHLVPQNTFTTAFQVTVPTASIRRVEFQLEGTAWVSIDDLEFESKPPTQPPVVEIRQRSVTEDPAVKGDFPKGWLVADAGARLRQRPPEQGDREIREFAEMLKKTQAPRIVEEDLSPGATRTVDLQIAGPSALSGSARWIGTVYPFAVHIALNGSTLVTGTTYRVGSNRGGSYLKAQTTAGGLATMSVTNTSGVTAKVRIVFTGTAL
jgi:hypothetical protein